MAHAISWKNAEDIYGQEQFLQCIDSEKEGRGRKKTNALRCINGGITEGGTEDGGRASVEGKDARGKLSCESERARD